MTKGVHDTTAGVVANHLKAAGALTMFGYPGDSNIELMEAARAVGVETVLASREGTATFMAQGLAMATGTLGVCTSTLGPGSSALVNGVAAANLDRVPLLAISGQIDRAREPYFTHQVLDHDLVFTPVTKWTGRVDPGAAATIMRKALRTATAERPGAVHLTVNADAAKATASDADVAVPPHTPQVSAPSVTLVDGAADPVSALRAARRPVILAGIGALRQQAGDGIVALAEARGLPIIVGGMAKGVVPEDHPRFAGVLEMACAELIYELLHDSDLVLAVGFDAVELFPRWTVAAPVIHIDTTPNTDQVYPASTEIVGSIPAALDWLVAEAGEAECFTEAELTAHRSRLLDRFHAGKTDGRMNPSDAMRVIDDVAPADAIMSTDVGSHKLLVGQGWRARGPRTFLMSNGLSSMGFGLPAAIGAGIAHPGRPVVAAIGDGGFAMVQSELRLASELGLALVVLVFSDQSLNRIEIKQMQRGYPSTATRIGRVDMPSLAEAMGCDGVRVETPAALEQALDGVGELARPRVIEAVIDPAQYETQFSPKG